MLQRFTDILLATFALILLSPLLVLISLILRFTGEGEVFYKQERVGRGATKFQLMKFATMMKDSPNIGTGTITIENDPRVLPLGSILRKTKINELPQLINVVLGDMSLIGPRPLTDETFAAYSADAQEIITKIQPGLSGLGSIVLRNEEKLLTGVNEHRSFYFEVVAPYKAELEIWYYNHRSYALYLTLVVVTVHVVIFADSKIIWKRFKDLPPLPSELSIRLEN